MNRFFPFISCAFVGILVSSCARNEPVYGSRSASPHRPAKHHHVALAQVPLRHRAASEGQRRPLRPWNHLPAASETPAAANATTPHTDHLPAAPETPAPANATTPPIRITSRQTPMSRHPLIPSRSGHPLIGAGRVTRRARSRRIFGPSLRSLELLLRRRQQATLRGRCIP
jgi:hypothetical protein